MIKVQIEDLLRLSPFQQSLLSEELAWGSRHSTPVQKAYRFHGNVDPELLQRVWRLIVSATPLLRSCVDWEGIETPVIVVQKQVSIPWLEHDWRSMPENEVAGALRSLYALERSTEFRLQSSPLSRVLVIRLTQSESVLLWTAHPMILDTWSMDLLVRQLWAGYEALAAGMNPDIPVENAFKAYTAWVYSQDTAPAASFWRKIAAEFPMNGGFDGRDGEAYEPANVRVEIADVSVRRLMAERTPLQLYPLICGVWARLLEFYFGDEQRRINAYVPGREGAFEGIERVCGPIGRFLPFVVPSPKGKTVHEWQRQLDLRWQEVIQHGHCGVEAVLQNPSPDSARPTEAAVIVAEAPFAAHLRSSSGQIVIEEIFVAQSPPHPLTLLVRRDVLPSVELHYDARCFSPDLIGSLAEHFEPLLRDFTAQPGQSALAIETLSPQERNQVLCWGQAATEEAPAQCVHQIVEIRASQHAGRIAALFEGESITYGELNARANQLARYLREAGVGQESIVGTFMPRCLETLVAILAIHKAGGCYLPLDTELPRDRVMLLLRDANPTVLLTKQDFLFELPQATPAKVFCLDSGWETISTNSDTDQPSDASVDAMAYVIHTSGSTGLPKGVAVSHRAAASHLTNMLKVFGYRESDRILQFASLSFDVSIEQLLAPLMSGATLFLKSNVPWTSAEFFAAVREQNVTVINVPPAFWTQLVEDMKDVPECLRLVILGGDVLPPKTVRRWQQSNPNKVQLINAYGPTEAVITATVFEVPADFSNEAERRCVPIGCTLPNRTAYVVNQSLDLAPPGAGQELVLGGDLLARGYLNRPELTAEFFVPDPFSHKPGSRLYRTGDRVRWSEEGYLEFQGRIDSQVKLRGYRIELGEIEAALAAYDGVRQAVVAVQLMDSGEKRLAAYVVPALEAQISPRELREAMKEKLPEYMVPAFFEIVHDLPLAASGKVDRKRLPAPTQTGMAADESGETATSAIEEAVMKIWTEVLAVSQIGTQDDFFDIGGDSLLATQVISRVQKAFGVEVSLRVLFDTPTIASLAKAIEEGAKNRRQEIALIRVSREDELPLSPAQERLWFLSQAGEQSAVYNMTGAIQLEGSLQVETLARSLTEIVRRHEALRTAFPFVGDHPVQEILPPYPVSLPVTDLSSLSDESRRQMFKELFQEEAGQVFNLMKGPLFRSRLIRMSQDTHILLATMHHIAGDAWSLQILARELSHLYGALLNDEKFTLPDLPFQYVDYAHWQKQLLARDAGQHLEYWRRRLGGSPAPSALPQEKPARGEAGLQGGTYSWHLSSEVASGLKALGYESGATLFMTLLSAWQLLLSGYSAKNDIVVGTDIATRKRGGTENIIGFFVNVLAMRTDLSGNPSFFELLDRVREVALGAYEHQDLPFNRLVEELNPVRNGGNTALFKTFFYMPIEGLRLLDLSGLKIKVLELEDHTAKFDLSLCAREDGSQILCNLNYRTDLFCEDAVRDIAGDYELLLNGIARKPETRINTLWSMVRRGSLSSNEAESLHAPGIV